MVLLLILAGFGIRLLTAAGTWLNPDEALNYLIANQKNLSAVYQASLTNPHPPLYFFILHGWRVLGTSEIILRLLSVLFSSAAIYFCYRWLAQALNPASGLAGAILFAFLPALVGNGTEIRSYSLMLLLVGISLFLMEKGVRTNRAVAITGAALFSALAGFSHYSALWFSIALGVYLLLNGLTRRLKFRVFWLGVISQTGVALVYLLLYLTHLKKISASPMTQFAVSGWLQENYLQPGENPLIFIFRNTAGLFRYLSGSPIAGFILLGLFSAGILTLIIKNLRLAVLILSPVIFAISGALVRIMPYGGTRHSILLGVFICAGAAGLGLILKPRYQSVMMAIASLIALVSNLIIRPAGQFIPRADYRRELMHQAIQYLRSRVLPGDTIFTDYQGSTLLSYYLTNPAQPVDFWGKGYDWLREFDYGGYKVVCTQDWDFNHQRLRFPVLIDRLSQYYHWQPNRLIWVFDGGWGRPLMMREEFGRNLSVFVVMPEMFLNPASAESLLLGAIRKLREMDLSGIRTLILPSRFASESVKKSAIKLGITPITYRGLYQLVPTGQKQFDAHLPALACWLFNCYEPHPEFMSYMADGESYIAGDYRFTLLLTDVNRQIAVYRLELHKN
jgi:hypothetical protein